MGKKKDKLLAKAQEAPAADKPKVEQREKTTPEGGASKKEVGAAAATPAELEACDHPEDVFSAAAVVFFTRDGQGKVARVLVALEERKVQASYIGLSQKGKVTQRMLLFPMGRREKKDKNDAVETAKREYVEETGDYGGLSKYLDVADFTDGDGDDKAAPAVTDPALWTGRQNMALYFKPASMIALFCEVPAAAAEDTRHFANEGRPIAEGGDGAKGADNDEAVARAADGDGGGDNAAKEPPKKKQKNAEAPTKPSPSYHVGRTDHLDASWVDAAVLRAAMGSGDKSPELQVGGVGCRVFPTAASVLRLPEAKVWLGVEAQTQSDKGTVG